MPLSTSTELSIGDAIVATAKLLESAALHFGHGTDNPLDEAAWLVLTAAELSPVLEPDYERKLTREEIGRCNSLIDRRIGERMPLAYLSGNAWFAGHRFLSDDRALVPRSPLAEFIVNDFHGLLAVDSPRILDLCTGSACIAIAAAYARMDASVVGSDLSGDALALAKANVAMHGMEDRVQLLEGDLFEPVSGTFDLILSNPPYVDADDFGSMPAEFQHEPALGLVAGVDGLDIVRRILAEAADYLEDTGILVVGVGNSAESLMRALPDIPFRWLSFEHGGDGVFLLARDDLVAVRQ